MVEQPNTTTTTTIDTKTVFSEKDSEKDSVETPLLVDIESATKTTTPITTNIRATVRHLTSTYGLMARYNGLATFMMWAFVSTVWRHIITINLVNGLDMYRPVAHAISTLAAGVIFARLHMLWTHMMIAVPGTSWAATGTNDSTVFKKLVPAAIMNAVAWEATVGLPVVLGWAMGLFVEKDGMLATTVQDGQPMECHEMYKMLLVVLVGVLSLIGLYIPAHVALVRVEASMLPAEVETVVSFDRTFGGRVIAESEGGSGKLGFVDAWRSFEKAQRVRLLKVFAKIFLVETVLHVFFGVLIVVELLTFVGAENLAKLAAMAQMKQ